MATANRAGSDFEHIVGRVLRRFRIGHSAERSEVRTGVLDSFQKEIIPDFKVYAPLLGSERFYIEAKYQHSLGSTMDKLPHVKDRALKLPAPLMVVLWGEQEECMHGYFEAELADSPRLRKMLCVKRFHDFFRWAAEHAEGISDTERSFEPSQLHLFR